MLYTRLATQNYCINILEVRTAWRSRGREPGASTAESPHALSLPCMQFPQLVLNRRMQPKHLASEDILHGGVVVAGQALQQLVRLLQGHTRHTRTSRLWCHRCLLSDQKIQSTREGALHGGVKVASQALQQLFSLRHTRHVESKCERRTAWRSRSRGPGAPAAGSPPSRRAAGPAARAPSGLPPPLPP